MCVCVFQYALCSHKANRTETWFFGSHRFFLKTICSIQSAWLLLQLVMVMVAVIAAWIKWLLVAPFSTVIAASAALSITSSTTDGVSPMLDWKHSLSRQPRPGWNWLLYPLTTPLLMRYWPPIVLHGEQSQRPQIYMLNDDDHSAVPLLLLWLH